jgi:hypothetical protein
MTQPTFPKPQFKLLPDLQGRRWYANVDNLLEVSNGEAVHYVALAVPTGLFTLMKDVLKVTPEERVSLALDRVEDRWYFSLMRGEEKLYDLWSYADSTLPKWVLAEEYYVDPGDGG